MERSARSVRIVPADISCMLMFFLTLCGCSSSKIISLEKFPADSTQDVIVALKDGSEYRFPGDQYDTLSVNNTKVLRGSGYLFIEKDRSERRKFDGDIQFDQIQEIQTEDPSGGDTLLSIGLIAGLAGMMLVLFGYTHLHMN